MRYIKSIQRKNWKKVSIASLLMFLVVWSIGYGYTFFDSSILIVNAASSTINCDGNSRELIVGVDFNTGDDLTLAQGTGPCTFIINRTEADSAISLASLTIQSGVTVSHAQTSITPDTYNWFGIDVMGDIDIQSGASINVIGLGYVGGNNGSNTLHIGYGVGNVTTTGAVGYVGGTHGGIGGSRNATPYVVSDAYDSITNPTLPGGGGGGYTGSDNNYYGGNGGGVIRLSGNNIIINGTISADGAAGPSSGTGGAGGAIYLNASGTISGNGTITSNGGTGNRGSGGGGRIALLYNEFIHSGTISTYSGNTLYDGSAGTIYKKSSTDSNGYLIVNNGGRTQAYYPTSIDTNNDQTFDSVVVSNYARLWIKPDATDFVSVNLQVDTNSVFENSNDAEFTNLTTNSLYLNGGTAIFQQDLNLTNATSDGSVIGLLSILGTTTVDSGTLNIGDALTMESFGTLQKSNGVYLDSISVTGTLVLSTSTEVIGDVTVNSGGNITHKSYTKTSSYTPSVKLNVGGDVIINSGGMISAIGKGYLGGYAYADNNTYIDGIPVLGDQNVSSVGYTGGNTQTGGSSGYAGGSHGGRGNNGYNGAYSALIYDSISNPTLPGGGGGGYYSVNYRGGSGGGVIRITSTNLIIDGTISADGAAGPSSGTGGGGGAINIDVSNAISGSGDITANGGTGNRGSGSGGRIALSYTTYTHSGTVSTYGGNTTYDGTAGTIYKKPSGQTFGDLIIDNGGRTQASYNTTISSTVPLSDQSITNNNGYAFNSVTTDNYGILNIPIGLDANGTGAMDANRKFFSSHCPLDNDIASDGEVTYNTPLYASGLTNNYACIATAGVNTAPTTLFLNTPIQTGMNVVTVTSTVADGDRDITSLAVEYSTDGTTWNDATLGSIIPNEGSVTTSIGSIAGIDTDFDGSVDMSIGWNAAADIPDTDDDTVYLRITPNDGTVDGTTITSSAFALDLATPTTPSNVTIADVTSTTVQIGYPTTISTDSNFESYTLYYATSTPITTSTALQVTTSTIADFATSNFNGSTSTLLSNLLPNTPYYFLIEARDIYGRSTIAPSEVSTTTLAETPNGLTFVSYSTSSITAVWNTGGTNNPAGTVYEVYNFTSSTSFGTTTDTNLLLTGLTPGHAYTVGVRAVNSAGVYTEYDTNNFATLPIAAQTPIAIAASTTTLDISIGTNLNGNTTTYAIYSSTDGVWIDTDGSSAGSPVYQDFNSWAPMTTVTGLSANTPHSFIVRAQATTATSSTASNVVYTYAAVPGMPTFSSITVNSMTIGWTSSTNPTGTVYELRLADDTLIATTTDTNYTHTSLDSNTSYTYKVRAINGDDVYTAYSPTASQSTTSNVSIVTIGTASQTSANIVTVTSTVSDVDSDVTSLAVEYSLDGSTWNDATLATVTDTEGVDGVTTSTGQISDIDTDNDGAVALTIEWDIATDIPDTDDATVYLRITPNDGTTDGASVSTTAFAVDTEAPVITDNGTITISTDTGAVGVAGLGDALTLSGVTTTINDGGRVEIDFGIATDVDGVLMGQPSFISPGTLDGFATFTIRVYDDIGNVSVTTSDAVSVDNQAPTFANNGTLSISTDNGTPGIAGIGDKITFSGASTTVSDSDTFTIDMSSIGGGANIVSGSSTSITAGSVDATTTFIITVTDNAGNTATTTSDGVSIDNIAPTAATGGALAVTTNVTGNSSTASIGDQVTYTAGSLDSPDTVSWVINLSTLTGQGSLAAGVASTAVVTGTLDSAMQLFVVTLTDDAGNTTTTTASGFSVDNTPPTVTDNGTVSISTDNGVENIAGVGDGLTLTGVTVAADDSDIITIDFGVAGGVDEKLMGQEDLLPAGAVDNAALTFVINLIDDAGNTATTVSDPVSVDTQLPVITANGTLSISTDANGNGIANIDDGVTLSGVTIGSADGDAVTINLSTITGNSSVAMSTETTITAGAVSSTSFTATITATDNAGNTATTSSDSISVNNVADVEEEEEEESESESSGGGVFTPPSVPTINIDADDTAGFSLNGGAGSTANRTVQAMFTGINNVSQIALSNSSDFSRISFMPFTTTINHMLSAGNGIKTVYARLRSSSGGSITLSDTIELIGQALTPTGPEGTTPTTCTLDTDSAYKVAGDSTIYYITAACTRRVISSPEKYFSYFASWDVITIVSELAITAIPEDTVSRGVPWGPRYNPASGTLVKTFANAEVYLLLNGTLYYIADEAAASYHFGEAWASWIIDVDPRLMTNYPFAADTLIENGTRPNGMLLTYDEDSKIYRLEADPTNETEQLIRHIADMPTFLSLNFRDDRIVIIPPSEVYREGTPITSQN